jgi:hypothetical protein
VLCAFPPDRSPWALAALSSPPSGPLGVARVDPLWNGSCTPHGNWRTIMAWPSGTRIRLSCVGPLAVPTAAAHLGAMWGAAGVVWLHGVFWQCVRSCSACAFGLQGESGGSSVVRGRCHVFLLRLGAAGVRVDAGGVRLPLRMGDGRVLGRLSRVFWPWEVWDGRLVRWSQVRWVRGRGMGRRSSVLCWAGAPRGCVRVPRPYSSELELGNLAYVAGT